MSRGLAALPLALSMLAIAAGIAAAKLVERGVRGPPSIRVPARRAMSVHSPTPIDEGDPLMYSSFFGAQIPLTEFRGRYVSLLLPPAWVETLAVDERRTLLDRSDLMYRHFADLMGAEPSGEGPLRIAFVPETCGWGCGQIGAKGIEILDAEWSLTSVRADLAAGSVPSVVTHEMAHNFDLYWNYLNSIPEYGHAWTAFLDAYIQVYSRQGYQYIAPEDLLRIRIEERLRPYLDDPSASWSSTTFDPKVMLAWGGIMLRMAELHGPRAIIGTLRELARYAAENPPPTTPEAKADLQIRMLALGTGTNLGGYVDAFRWVASPELRAFMDATFGPASPPGDGDAEREGAVETCVSGEHGVDAGHADHAAAIPFPARVRGVGSDSDDDHFAFTLPGPTHVHFLVRPSPGFEGWLFVHAEDRNSWLASVAIEPGTPASTSIRYPSGGSYELSVFHPGETPAEYELDVAPLDPWPIEWATLRPPARVGPAYRLALELLPNAFDAIAPDLARGAAASANGTGALEARFWVSTVGFVGAAPLLGPRAAVDWVPPAELAPGTYVYRAQLFVDGLPVSRDTDAMRFTVSGGRGAPRADAGTDRDVECTGALTWVMLDATGSSDPDGDRLEYTWLAPDGSMLASGVRATVALPLGVHAIELVVRDASGRTGSDSVQVRLGDTRPPALEVDVDPGILHPANDRLVHVHAHVEAHDSCDPAPRVLLVAIAASERSSGDIADASIGTDDRTFRLRAEARPRHEGRTYRVTYRASDAAGNTRESSAEVLVPRRH